MIRPTQLDGQQVSLLPLTMEHRDGLQAAVRDGELWRLWFTSIPEPDGLQAEIERRLALQAKGTTIPFTVFDGSGRIVGMSSYLNIDHDAPRLEIGATWYARRVQRTALNTEAKLLLLRHAFETIGCLAVEFRTHVLNQASRRAIERLGARLDGVLRCHQRARDGTIRDSCVYSITAPEWPSVRSHLAWQLERAR